MLVRKFGGTSMGSEGSLKVVTDIVKSHRGKQAVVVSAMSGVTDELIAATNAALANKPVILEKTIVNLAAKHTDTIKKTIRNVATQIDVIGYIDCVLKDLRNFLKAIGEIGELSTRSRDKILATGERLSSGMLAGILSDHGVPAEQIDFEKAIPDSFECANHDFYLAAEKIFARHVKKIIQKKKTPIITGYFGYVPGGMLAAVGRGYSDFCAALVAAGMRAKNLEIWTDVSGILTADPRKVSKARVVDLISCEAAAELAHFGAKVLHPQAVHPATRAKIPVWIKNTFDPKAHGTKIVSVIKKPKRIFTSITSKKGQTVVNIASYRMLLQHGFLAKIFKTFESYNIPIDVVSTSEVSVSVTIEDTNCLPEIVAELRPFAKITVSPKKAIVCLVGLGMKDKKGVAGEVFSVIAKVGISADMISQGASEINITFVVDESEADQALKILHKKFFENGKI